MLRCHRVGKLSQPHTSPFTRVLLAALLGLLSTTAGAATLEVVALDQAAAAEGEDVACTVVVAPRSGSAEAMRVPTRPGETVRLPDLDEGLWEVRVDAPDRWTESRIVHLTPGQTERSVIHLQPLAHIAGTVQADGNGAAAEPPMHLAFTAGQDSDDHQLAMPASVPCDVDTGTFRCPLPAGLWNLRLRTPGHVSHFFWDFKLEDGETTNVGHLVFEEGSSVFGFVPACEGEEPDPSCSVECRPYFGPASSPLDENRREILKSTVPVDERGFFHAHSLAAGTYELEVSKEGLASTSVFPVEIFPGAETEIAEPIHLARPVTASVSVQPPLDPEGRPWRIGFFEVGLAPTEVRPIARGSLRDGRWRSSPIAPGEYRVHILDRRGSRWHAQSWTVDAENPDLDIQLPIMTVEGTVRLGEQPLAAELVFGGRFGERSVATESDDDGTFLVDLPSRDSWDVGISSAAPSVHRTLKEVPVPKPEGGGRAHLELTLPDTRIFGKVVDSHGVPVAKALVTAIDYQRREHPETIRSDDLGNFEFLGLGPGSIRLNARKSGMHSDDETAHLADEQSQSRRFLTLRRGTIVQGQVVSSRGPVAGARVTVMPVGSTVGAERVTDALGRFSSHVPSSSSALDIVVRSPAAALTATRTPILDGQVTVQVDDDGGHLLIPGGIRSLAQTTPSGLALVFLRGPVLISQASLVEWHAIQGSLSHDDNPGQEIVLRNLAAGEYRACALRGDEIQAFVDRRVEPVRCVSTYVVPGQVSLLDLEEVVPSE